MTAIQYAAQAFRRCLLLPAILALIAGERADAGTWTQLTNSAPSGANVMLLLSDGSVMAQAGGGAAWYRLKPDIHGSYVNGTWTTLASMHDTRQYYSLQMLKDGRLFVAGGEYGTGGKTSEVYDPVTNSWTLTPSSGQNFVDSVSEILGDGRVMVAPVSGPASTVIYDPVANTWTTGPATLHGQDEVPWIKLPDGSILCVDGNSQSERYIPSLNQWVADANTPVVLYSGGETGSGHLLASGKAFFRGYTHTAIYTPSGTSSPGTWVAGPDVPGGLNTGDSPGAVMTNGKVLFVAGPGYLTGPTSFFEYDPAANTIAQINGPTGATYNNVPYGMKMLAMPDGSVLVNVGSTLYQYLSGGVNVGAFPPLISSITHNADGSFHLAGTNLNGFSEGAAYGDDFQMATNFPIVRLSDGAGNVFFARSYNWSSTGVQTGATAVTTEFTLPQNLPAGTYNVVVVANGIASAALALTTPFVPGDAAPTVFTAAAATPGAVTGTTTTLSVLGADTDGGNESNLVYTWSTTSAPTGVATPSFSLNGTNAAKNVTATFYHAGSYTFAVTITDSSGLSTSSSVTVTVNQTLTSGTLLPAITNLTSGQTQQLTATGLDQFGVAMTSQPSFTWALTSGGGSVNGSGLYTSPGSGTLAAITATTGSIQVSATISVVSSPWVSADINAPALTGTGYDSSGTFTLTGGGNTIGSTADQFHYVYRSLGGDGAIIARVVSVQTAGTSARAGVMIRESTAVGAVNAMMSLNASNVTLFHSRATTDGNTSSSSTGSRPAPYWVKLVRTGNSFTGYASANGTNWSQQGTASLTMGSSALIGFAVCSYNTSALATATFDNISVLAAQNDALTARAGIGATVNVLANDVGPNGATLTVTAVTPGAKGVVVNNGDGTVTYTAAANAIGSDAFTYTVSDGLGDTATATVLVHINGLQAYYKFEEGSGTTSADETASFNCTLNGATWTTGVEGTSGLAFAGASTSTAAIPALNLNTNAMTIAGWVKRNGSQNSYAGLVFCRAGTTVSGLDFGTANELRYHWNNTPGSYGYNSGLVPPDGQWTFVALVIAATNAKFYMQPLGGAMQTATNTLANAVQAFDGVTTLGQDTSSSTRCFNGALDEVRIYDTSLSAAQIAALAVATPTVATAAAANPTTTTSFTTSLSALGTSNIYAEPALSYTWSTTSFPNGATPPTFSANGANAAKNCTATIYQSGSYTFRVTIADPAGGSITSSANLTANLAPFDNWRGQQFGTSATNPAIAGPTADPDNDGLNNLLEYALGTNPNAANQSGVVSSIETISGANYLRLTVAKNPNATDLQYTVEATGTIGDSTSWGVGGLVIETNTATQLVVRDNVPISSGTARFMRLRVVKP